MPVAAAVEPTAACSIREVRLRIYFYNTIAPQNLCSDAQVKLMHNETGRVGDREVMTSSEITYSYKQYFKLEILEHYIVQYNGGFLPEIILLTLELPGM